MSIATRAPMIDLLPALYRERDLPELEGRNALRELLELVGEQAALVEQDIEELWDNLFIETSRRWVIPYIGDLVGNELLHDTSASRGTLTAEEHFLDLIGPDLRPPPAVRTRADVAKTISYRRRKGTIAMLEELARDVTGWPAHAVEFFQLLGWTQNVEHVRTRVGWVDVRSVERMDRVDGPFDETSHTVDVRPIGQADGWHNVPNIGLFLWRLQSFGLENVPATEASLPWRFHFSPLGNPAPLFTRGRREASPTGLALELDVAGPIRRALLHSDLAAAEPGADFTELYGLFEPVAGSAMAVCSDCSFVVFVDGAPVPPERVHCRRLRPWPPAQPSGDIVAVDVEHGRIALGTGLVGAAGGAGVDTAHHYGFPAGIGGGTYDRGKWLVRADAAELRLTVLTGATGSQDRYGSVTAALTRWQNEGRPEATITILDSRTYALPATLRLPNDASLTIQADNRQRPVLEAPTQGLELDVAPPADPDDPERAAELTLGGVVVTGFLHVVGDLARLRLLHATLVPGRALDEEGDPGGSDPSIYVDTERDGKAINAELRLEFAYSISGPIVAPAHARPVLLLDSILDGVGARALHGGAGEPGPALEVERSTILGEAVVRSLDASETVFTGRVMATRTQDGCVRFSYVSPGSRTPRRYRCQPDLAVAREFGRRPTLSQAEQAVVRERLERRTVPDFTSDRYGQPAYAQLRLSTPREIAAGGEDGSEMGVFNHLQQSQRLRNLEIRVQEYLPFGLEAGPIFVT
jgi:hypothetical protein